MVGKVDGIGQSLHIQPIAVHQRHHIELNAALKQATIITSSLHHQRKAGQLGCPLVNIEAKQILLQDQLRNLPLLIATLQIDRLEQLIGFH